MTFPLSDLFTPAQASPDATAPAHGQNWLDEALDWTKSNIADPLVNAGAITPYNAVVSTFDAITGHSTANEAQSLSVGQAKFLSPSWFAQEVSGALGMIVPYVIAGKATGGAMRLAGARLGMEGTAAALMQDGRVAQILGAGVYGGMQAPQKGESRLGNALSSVAAFSVFEAGNSLTNDLSRQAVAGSMSTSLLSRTAFIGEKVGLRALTGVAGGLSQVTVSDGVSNHALPTGSELLQAGVGGAVINVGLAPAQSLAMRALDGVNQKIGLGTPIDRYVSYNPDLKASISESSTLSKLLSDNPWTRVLDNKPVDSANSQSNRITLKSPVDAQMFGHELTHLENNGDSSSEDGFSRAQALLKGGNDTEAWNTYRATRADQEIAARQNQSQIAYELGDLSHSSPDLAKNIGSTKTDNGNTLDSSWRNEFEQFKKSGGTFRPNVNYGGLDRQLSPEEATAESEYQKGVATSLVKDLQDQGHIAVFAGGSVRDELMGNTPNDFDIATSATPKQVEQVFKSLGMTVFPKGESFGVECVVVDGRQYEIATLRADGEYTDGRRPDNVKFVTSLKDDAARRDLTINAMFKDPISGKIYDFFGGQDDLKNKVLKAVGDPNQRIAEDKLRMMRVPRFLAKLPGFSVDSDLDSAIKAHSDQITSVSGERIRDELQGILTAKDPVQGLQYMMDTGLMKAALPEVAAMDGPKGMQDKEWHPEGTAWAHTKLAVDVLKGSSFELALAGLLHDIGKPLTQQIHEDGGISNHDHENVGADMAKEIAGRLKLTNKQTDRIVELVRNHMRMHQVDTLSDKALKRILVRPDINDLIELEHADSTGRGAGAKGEGSHKEFLLNALHDFQQAPETQRLGAQPIVTGDVLRQMDFRPGPAFRSILDATNDAQLEGQFTTLADGRKFVTDNFGHLKGISFNDQIAMGLGADQS